MTASREQPPGTYPAPGGTLGLLTIPFIFTQDDLLTSADFLRQAKDRGHDLSLDGLQVLHSHRLLIPLYRVTDSPVDGRRIAVEWDGGPNPRGWTLQAAADGRLRDSSDEGYSAAWPYMRPQGEDPTQWWNGFIFSSWQLLQVREALNRYQWIKHGFHRRFEAQCQRRAWRLQLVLAALSTRYLPSVLGRLSAPVGLSFDELRQYRAESDLHGLLRIADFDPADLRKEAEALLGAAHGEPLARWLPLVRYAHYDGWSKLRGEPLDAMWRRVAAEILLLAHEDLIVEGLLEPLPDLTGTRDWTPLHDRLTARYAEAETLERALAELGLSPHPRVILLVEGETELEHLPKLLAEFGLTQPQQVRMQRTKGSKINAHLIARYGVTPRVGRKVHDRWLLDASPTALVIAMDAENDFETQAMRDEVRRRLRAAIREEVEYQDAEIGDDELDALVHVHVWGDDKYELANFSDDELVPAITTLAEGQHNPLVRSSTWDTDLRAELQTARKVHQDIKVPLGHMHVREDKVGLARLLWPALRAKCEAEYVAGAVSTPVLKVVLEVRDLVAKLTGVFALRGPGGDA